ncbi:MAG: hypothetical protein QOF21_1629 [Actinomycetota bacterium]|jgi:amino acid transporter
MNYGSSAANIGAPALAATGFAFAGWLVGAVTLVLLGFVLMQLARRSPSLRP